METLIGEIKDFDVYETSKEYTHSVPKKGSCKKRDYWNNSNSFLAFRVVQDICFHALSDSGHITAKASNVKNHSYGSFYSVDNDRFLLNKNEVIEIILKDKKFYISSKLSEIADEILYSVEILDYDNNWDYDNAEPVSEVLYIAGIKFLIDYSEYILKNLGVVIQSPEINAGRNGNIYLAWRTEKARLGISIEENNGEISAFYYGDLGNDRNVVKGNVNVINVEDYLAYWMKYLV